MSGDWIKIERTTPDKPEVFKLARILRIDRDAVVGKLVRFWAWLDANARNAVVDALVTHDVDDLTGCDGFGDALLKVGWLRRGASEDQVEIPNFDRHNGKSSKNRALTSERQAKFRESRNVSVDEIVTPTTLPEKRREEKREDQELLPTSNDVGVETTVSTCPVARIIDLYHEVLPELPRVQKVTPKRRGYIQQRWREDLTDLDDWRDFFTNDVRQSRFLMGKTAPVNGHKLFRADLEWLTNQTNFAKIIEGKYRG